MSEAEAKGGAGAAPAIVIAGLSKRFGRTLALDDVSLTVESGTVFALLGPNGAGKTTLIEILCTIRPFESGRVEVAGIDVARHPRPARRRIGVVFQDPTLDTRLTVQENLEFHGLVYQMRRAERRRRLDEMLELTELTDWRGAVVRTLSSGMKRRLEIARALMHQPRILFLDEPTVGLDAQARTRIWGYIEAMRRAQDLTIVVTTHYIEEVESCNRVCIIDQGRILADGTPAALKAAHGTALVRATPTTPAAAAAIRARYPDVVEGVDGELVIPMKQAGGADALLADFGRDLRHITFDQPSLESVFLTLTGRDLREPPPPAPARRRGNAR